MYTIDACDAPDTKLFVAHSRHSLYTQKCTGKLNLRIANAVPRTLLRTCARPFSHRAARSRDSGVPQASSQTFERRADSRARRNVFPLKRPHVHAMSTHLPIRVLRPLHRQCLFRHVESRSFSTTLARPATRRKRSVDPAQTAAAVRYQIQGAKASSVVYEEQLKDDNNLPDDIGLLPGICACWLRDPLILIRDGRNLHSQADIP
jgi:hypothetical protein